jgi:multimeric flavodoxin WrbA
MPNLLVVSHQPSEHTRAMTQAVVRGARSPEIPGVEVRLERPLVAGPDDVLWADGVILGTTENFGYMSGAMKDFFDRVYYPCLDQTEALPWCLFVRAGNDGRGARSSIERIVAGLAWKQVQEPLICRGAWTDEWLEDCEELGLTMAAGLEAGVF